jgi:hypothetical protein
MVDLHGFEKVESSVRGNKLWMLSVLCFFCRATRFTLPFHLTVLDVSGCLLGNYQFMYSLCFM